MFKYPRTLSLFFVIVLLFCNTVFGYNSNYNRQNMRLQTRLRLRNSYDNHNSNSATDDFIQNYVNCKNYDGISYNNNCGKSNSNSYDNSVTKTKLLKMIPTTLLSTLLLTTTSITVANAVDASKLFLQSEKEINNLQNDFRILEQEWSGVKKDINNSNNKIAQCFEMLKKTAKEVETVQANVQKVILKGKQMFL